MSKKQNEELIYLAHTGNDTHDLRQRVDIMLHRAGLRVVSSQKTNPETLSSLPIKCSVHIIGKELGQDNISKIEHDFHQANLRYQSDPSFSIFVWYPQKMVSASANSDSQKLLNTVRNNIMGNTIFSTHDSAVLFVEDLRSLLQSESTNEFHVKDSDVFFIYNTIDYLPARETIDLLSDIALIEVLKIDSSSPANYSEYIAKQIHRSKLTVVFYDKAKDWSLPFIQQIWKNSGGASVPGFFLLIGSSENEEVHSISFEAPKATVKSAPLEMIPLEIKVELDKLNHND